MTRSVDSKWSGQLTGFGIFTSLDTPKMSTSAVAGSDDSIDLHNKAWSRSLHFFAVNIGPGVLVCSNANALECDAVRWTTSLFAQQTGSTSHSMFESVRLGSLLMVGIRKVLCRSGLLNHPPFPFPLGKANWSLHLCVCVTVYF